MKRFTYFLRVLIVSWEATLLIIIAYIFLSPPEYLIALSNHINPNEDFTKYMALLPVASLICSWKECHDMIFNEKDISKLLVNWPGYWKLKTHVYCSLLYSFIFCTTCIFIWAISSNKILGLNFILFGASFAGCLVTLASLYLAKITIKELIIRE